jgi:hypothetical protein
MLAKRAQRYTACHAKIGSHESAPSYLTYIKLQKSDEANYIMTKSGFKATHDVVLQRKNDESTKCDVKDNKLGVTWFVA